MASRRAFLVSLAALPLATGANALVSAPAGAAVPPGLLAIARQIDDITSLDPHEAFEASGGEIVGNLYDRLVVVDPADRSRVTGDLAESWTVSEDGREFRFTLREGRSFASGAPVTAEDVAFSLQRAVRLAKAPAFIIGQFGLTPANVAEAITTEGPRGVVLRLPSRWATSFVLYCLAANAASIVEKAAVLARAQGEDQGNGWLRGNSAGSGPYVLRAWRASESVVLEANPRHPRPPAISRVILRHVPDPTTQFLQLRQGDIDIARNLGPEQIAQAEADPELRVLRQERAFVMYIALNRAHPALAKPQVAQAIKWAVDYGAIERNLVRGIWRVHQDALPAGIPGALTDTPFRRDLPRARALLAEAGLADGFEITLDHPAAQPYADVAQALQADLAAIGIRLRLQSGEQRQIITKTRARQHEAALLYWGSDYYDPNSNAQAFAANPDDGDNASLRTVAWRNHFHDPALSQAVQDAARETDTAKRLAAYAAIQHRLRETSPFPILLQQQEVAVVRRGVEGFALGGPAYRTLYSGVKKVS
ncbi:ABC transporter substrate-binding protein [Roseomonas sp. GC11]|uniref:ABC transporter substrate-binding protein n=1 Tax=Roseomonas sp. GC11 TaxID=2950546 RepID=UPI00210D02E7|nr:ABC transporter substrate-binding protein [Roseomonas sp. GC11]MCQ4162131.1 ABC transporter substrate-binding protein [Roseomonas sp. GC11]